jgi:VWFA-related protein
MNLKLVAALVTASALLAQAPQSNQPTIRVTTRLVEVNVIARAKNASVRDLTKDDFTITDKGKPQKIAFFSVNSVSRQPKPSAQLPPNVFTNRVGQEVGGTATIVLLDLLNTQFSNQVRARKALIDFLGQVRPGDRIGVYILGSKLSVLQEFTSDSERLVKTLARLRADLSALSPDVAGVTELTRKVSDDKDASTNTGSAFQPNNPMLSSGAAAAGAASSGAGSTGAAGSTTTSNSAANADGSTDAAADKTNEDADAKREAEIAATQRVIDNALKESFAVAAGYQEIARVQRTAAGIEEVARHLARTPGRKNLIWLTDGFRLLNFDVAKAIQMSAPGNGVSRSVLNRNFSDELVRASHALNDANIAVYPVDARGLDAGGPSPAIGTFLSIAQLTGGRAFYNSNDIQTGIRQVVEESEVTYTIGFYPDPGVLDLKYHDIQVAVNRPGIDLRYRKGYTASPEGPLAGDEATNWVYNTATSALDITELSLTAVIDEIPAREKGVRRITLNLTPTDMLLASKGSDQIGGLDIVFSERSAQGENLGLITNTLDVTCAQGRCRGELRDKADWMKTIDSPDPSQIRLETTFLAKPTTSAIRVMVLDRNSGRIGSLAVPLAVR